jgi:hypothetical protein
MDETKAARSLLENRYGSGILRDALQHLQRPVINVALKTRPVFMIKNEIAQPTDQRVLLATFGMKFKKYCGTNKATRPTRYCVTNSVHLSTDRKERRTRNMK